MLRTDEKRSQAPRTFAQSAAYASCGIEPEAAQLIYIRLLFEPLL